jgi:hypothetical protein
MNNEILGLEKPHWNFWVFRVRVTDTALPQRVLEFMEPIRVASVIRYEYQGVDVAMSRLVFMWILL